VLWTWFPITPIYFDCGCKANPPDHTYNCGADPETYGYEITAGARLDGREQRQWCGSQCDSSRIPERENQSMVGKTWTVDVWARGDVTKPPPGS
jgi:hypothetical protein